MYFTDGDGQEVYRQRPEDSEWIEAKDVESVYRYLADHGQLTLGPHEVGNSFFKARLKEIKEDPKQGFGDTDLYSLATSFFTMGMECAYQDAKGELDECIKELERSKRF